MVLVNGIKYACERCIRGHRVTTCNHTDQPLMMIKPKGRPSTTCSHCKELRKNKNANPSGECTCGRQEKKRLAQKAKEEARAKAKSKDDCRCIETDKCTCHARRKNRRPAASKSGKITATHNTASSIKSADSPPVANLDVGDFMGKVAKTHVMGSLPSFHSSQSLDRDFSIAASPTLSPALNSSMHSNAFNWDTNSITSSLRSDSRVNLSDRGHHSFTPELSQSNKALSPSSRARVGEVSIPLEEYSSSDLQGMSGSMDNSGFSNRMGWPETDANHGPLDLFADTSENLNTNYMSLKSNWQRNKGSNCGLNSTHSASELREHPVPLSRSFSTQRDVPKPLVSRTSVDSIISDSSRLSHSVVNGTDLSTTNQSVPYISARQLQPRMSFGGYNLPPGCIDEENAKSVEVLSLTPSFMDIPDNTNLYSATSNPFLHKQGDIEPRKRSVSIHRNHRYDSFSKPSSWNHKHMPPYHQRQSSHSHLEYEVKREHTPQSCCQDGSSDHNATSNLDSMSAPRMKLAFTRERE